MAISGSAANRVDWNSGQPRASAGRLLQVDGMDERVGVAMHHLPVGPVAAINLGDAQRPVLVGQAADLPVLPLDHHEDDGVAPGVRLMEPVPRETSDNPDTDTPQAARAVKPRLS
jgi:hypothetical protein